MTAPAESRLDPDALAALEEQHAFLTRSLDDLDREHDAGDLDDADHAALRADYEARLAAITAALEERRATFSRARRTRPPAKTALAVGAVALFVLACGFGVAHLAGRRPAGATSTGDSRQDPRALLTQCLADVSGNSAQAVSCYDAVLKIDPTNIEAKTYRAGIQVMANGDTSQIVSLIDVATTNPSYPDVHAFLAIAFDRLGRPDSALAELRKLDALHPTPLIRDLVSDLRTQLEAAVGGSTTAPSTTTP